VTPLSDERLAPAPSRSRRRLALAALLIMVVAFTTMYVYAFFFATHHSPDKVPDRAWAAAAQARCTTDRARINALPPASSVKDVKPLTEALRQRAAVVEQANTILGEELAALKAIPTADATTAKLATQWLTDYDAYLADRVAHVAELRAGRNVPFAEGTYKGSPMSNRMDAFARVNLMPACQVPLDLA
jgi:hypothetical protein